MLKSFLILGGALVLSATGLQAQGTHSLAGRSAMAARPAAYRGSDHYGGSGYRGGHHGNWGRNYYLGGIPYFYPFGYGFGYPYYYGGFGYPYGYGGSPYNNGAYNGSIADRGNSDEPSGGASLPEAVQRQLAKRGYYKGSVDGQFGPESRSALSRFQKKQGLKETGKIDEPTLEALGFTDQH